LFFVNYAVILLVYKDVYTVIPQTTASVKKVSLYPFSYYLLNSMASRISTRSTLFRLPS